MKKVIVILSAAVIVAGATAFTLVSNNMWTTDASAATVKFTMPNNNNEGGSLGGLKANINFNPADLLASRLEATMDVNTINTGNEKRDDHLKAPDFFDAAKYPEIKFTSEKITKTETGFIAAGKLAMKDSTHMVEIPFTFEPKGENEGVFKGKLEVLGGDYGIMKKSPTKKDLVVVTIEVPVKK